MKADFAIRADTHRSLGVGFKRKRNIALGTAKPNSSLLCIGVSNPFNIYVPGAGTYTVSPVVLQTLTDEINVGNSFLHRLSRDHEVSIKYKNGEIELSVNSVCEPLLQQLAAEAAQAASPGLSSAGQAGRASQRGAAARPAKATTTAPPGPRNPAVLSLRNDIIDPYSFKWIRVDSPAGLKSGTILEAENNEYSYGGLELLEAVYCPDEQTLVCPEGRMLAVCVINPSCEPKMIHKNEVLGSFHEVHVIEKEDEDEQQSSPCEAGDDISVQRLRPIRKPGQPPIDNESYDFWQPKQYNTSSGYPEGKGPPVDRKIREQIIKELKIEENPVLSEHPIIKDQVKQLLHEFADVFSRPGRELGRTNLVEYAPVLKDPNLPPHKVRPRLMSPEQEKILKDQLKYLLDNGVISPCNSQWGASLVPVLRAGQSIDKTRFCVDTRVLNDRLLDNNYPLGSIQANLQDLAGNNFFSVLDCKRGYHTLPVAKEARPLISFVCSQGHFMFNYCPFGLKDLPSTFQCFLDLLVKNIKGGKLTVYLDDVMAATKTVPEQVEQLRKLFYMLRYAGILLSPSKCFLFQTKCNYLGYTVSAAGIEMNSGYVDRIQMWEHHHIDSGKQMQKFLGFVGYYRDFIKEFSALTADMNAFRNKRKVIWSPKMIKDLATLKAKFLERPIRGYPRFDTENLLEVETDYSKVGIGVVLSQVQDGKKRFINCAGRKLTEAESHYPSWKGELLAVIFALKKFRHLLQIRKFKLFTDNKAIVSFRKLQPHSSMAVRWLELLEDFNFDVMHRPGRELVADVISRTPAILEEPSDDNRYEDRPCGLTVQEFNGAGGQPAGSAAQPPPPRQSAAAVSQLAGQTSALPSAAASKVKSESVPARQAADLSDIECAVLSAGINELFIEEDITAARLYEIQNISEADRQRAHLSLGKQEVAAAQKSDSVLQIVRQWVKAGAAPPNEELRGKDPELRQYQKLFPQLIIRDDCLYLQHRANTEFTPGSARLRLVMPTDLFYAVFTWSHSYSASGHNGIEGTVQRAQREFFFFGMFTYLKDLASTCPDCLHRLVTREQLKSGAHFPRAGQQSAVHDCLNLDLQGPHTMSPQGYRYSLTCLDEYSRMCFLFPLRSKSAVEVAQCLFEQLYCRVGLWRSCRSDRGSEFVNDVQKELNKLLEIKAEYSLPYSPQNQLCERTHRKINEILRSLIDDTEDDWTRYLGFVQLALNSRICQSTGLSPYFAFFNREPVLPVNLAFPPPDLELKTNHQIIKDYVQIIKHVFKHVTKHQQTAIRRTANQYKALPAYSDGVKVWYLAPVIKHVQGRKYQDKWVGPFVVKKRISDVIYVIYEENNPNREILSHYGRLQPFHRDSARNKQFKLTRNVSLNIDAAEDGAELNVGRDVDLSEGESVGPARHKLHVSAPAADAIMYDLGLWKKKQEQMMLAAARQQPAPTPRDSLASSGLPSLPSTRPPSPPPGPPGPPRPPGPPSSSSSSPASYDPYRDATAPEPSDSDRMPPPPAPGPAPGPSRPSTRSSSRPSTAGGGKRPRDDLSSPEEERRTRSRTSSEDSRGRKRKPKLLQSASKRIKNFMDRLNPPDSSSDSDTAVQALSDLISSLTLDVNNYNLCKLDAPCSGFQVPVQEKRVQLQRPVGNSDATAAAATDCIQIPSAGRAPASAAAALPAAAHASRSYDCLPRKVTAIKLGLQLSVPAGYKLQFAALPGLTAAGLLLQPTFIYPTEDIQSICVHFFNSTEQILKIRKNQRIVSLIFSPYVECDFQIDKKAKPCTSIDLDDHDPGQDTAIEDDSGRSFVGLQVDHMDRFGRDHWDKFDPSGLGERLQP